jgi:hypothetical protein
MSKHKQNLIVCGKFIAPVEVSPLKKLNRNQSVDPKSPKAGLAVVEVNIETASKMLKE